MLDATLLPAWSLGTIISCWARALQGVLVRITLMFIWPTQISWMIWRVTAKKKQSLQVSEIGPESEPALCFVQRSVFRAANLRVSGRITQIIWRELRMQSIYKEYFVVPSTVLAR
jgi:hypothetical protein